MKKFLTVLATAALLCCMLTTAVYANPNMKGDVGTISTPYSTPTIDGTITTSEGWSVGICAYKDVMATFGNTNDILQSFKIYYAYDDTGIYFAADIFDNSFIYSTGSDNIDNRVDDFNIKDENVYGYNGDIFTFAVDPLGLFYDAGYIQNTDYNTWYSVGIFEGNYCKMYRGHNNSGDVTDTVSVQGHATENGWCFEAYIPWSFVVEDIENASFGELSATAAQLCADGASHRAMAIYMDRYYDDELGEVATYQRFATCAYKLQDGTMGYLTSGVCLKSYGIILSFAGKGKDTHAYVPTVDSDTASVPIYASGSITRAPATSSATGASAVQTFDFGIGIAVAALVVAVIGIWFSKRKK